MIGFLLLALICFGLAAANVDGKRVNLIALGLFFFILSQLWDWVTALFA